MSVCVSDTSEASRRGIRSDEALRIRSSPFLTSFTSALLPSLSMMTRNGWRKSRWKEKSLSSGFSRNLNESCRKESMAYIATVSFEWHPTTAKCLLISPQILVHTILDLMFMFTEATSTILCSAKTLALEPPPPSFTTLPGDLTLDTPRAVSPDTSAADTLTSWVMKCSMPETATSEAVEKEEMFVTLETAAESASPRSSPLLTGEGD